MFIKKVNYANQKYSNHRVPLENKSLLRWHLHLFHESKTAKIKEGNKKPVMSVE